MSISFNNTLPRTDLTAWVPDGLPSRRSPWNCLDPAANEDLKPPKPLGRKKTSLRGFLVLYHPIFFRTSRARALFKGMNMLPSWWLLKNMGCYDAISDHRVDQLLFIVFLHGMAVEVPLRPEICGVYLQVRLYCSLDWCFWIRLLWRWTSLSRATSYRHIQSSVYSSV